MLLWREKKYEQQMSWRISKDPVLKNFFGNYVYGFHFA